MKKIILIILMCTPLFAQTVADTEITQVTLPEAVFYARTLCDNIIFVGDTDAQIGSADRHGQNIQAAVNDISTAITKITALAPSASKQCLIFVVDSRTYSETATLPNYVDILLLTGNAPNISPGTTSSNIYNIKTGNIPFSGITGQPRDNPQLVTTLDSLAYINNWGNINGGVRFINNVVYNISDDENLELIDDFTFIFDVYFYGFGVNLTPLINKYSSAGDQRSYAAGLNSSKNFIFYKSPDGINVTAYTFNDFTFELNKKYNIVVLRSGNSLKLYVNKDLKQTLPISSSILNSTVPFKMGTTGISSDFLNGQINDLKLYNLALTSTEITNLYANGLGSETSYELQGASQTSLTSGTLIKGKKYIIDTYVAGDDFTNIGGVNASGEIFVSTGTTPTTWTNSSSLRQIGEVLNLDPFTVNNDFWYDQSGNELHAIPSGPPTVLNKKDIVTIGQVIANNLRLVSPTVPASASDTGVAGQIAWDSTYIYICIAANTWKRVLISTW